jgi:hypothetical protein
MTFRCRTSPSKLLTAVELCPVLPEKSPFHHPALNSMPQPRGTPLALSWVNTLARTIPVTNTKVIFVFTLPLILLVGCGPAIYDGNGTQMKEPLYPTSIPTAIVAKASPSPALTKDEKTQFTMLFSGVDVLNTTDALVTPPAGETADQTSARQAQIKASAPAVQSLASAVNANCTVHPIQKQSTGSSSVRGGDDETLSSTYGMEGTKCPLQTQHTTTTESTIVSNTDGETSSTLLAKIHMTSNLTRNVSDVSVIPGLSVDQEIMQTEAYGLQQSQTTNQQTQTRLYLKRTGIGKVQFAPKIKGDDPIVAQMTETEEYLKTLDGRVSNKIEIIILYPKNPANKKDTNKTIYQLTYTSVTKSAGTTDAHVYLNGEEITNNPFFQLPTNHWQKSNSNDSVLTPVFN